MKLTPLQILIFSIFIFGMLLMLYKSVGWIMVKVNHHYTIGVTHGAVYSSRGSYDVGFDYSVKGKMYKNSHSASIEEKDRNGAFFLVRYFPFFPYWSQMDFDVSVDTSVIKPPFDGWDEIPEELKKKN